MAEVESTEPRSRCHPSLNQSRVQRRIAISHCARELAHSRLDPRGIRCPRARKASRRTSDLHQTSVNRVDSPLYKPLTPISHFTLHSCLSSPLARLRWLRMHCLTREAGRAQPRVAKLRAVRENPNMTPVVVIPGSGGSIERRGRSSNDSVLPVSGKRFEAVLRSTRWLTSLPLSALYRSLRCTRLGYTHSHCLA